VPLPAALLDELLALAPAGAAADCRLLGFHKNSPLQGISRLKTALDRDSAVTDWRMHDLRRTCRTGLAALAVPNEIAEACLNHVSTRSALERTYNRFDYRNEILAALTRWQQHVAEIIKPETVMAAA
jgi:integrase